MIVRQCQQELDLTRPYIQIETSDKGGIKVAVAALSLNVYLEQLAI